MNYLNKFLFCSLIACNSTAYCAPYLSGQIGGASVPFSFSTPYSSYQIDKTTLVTRLAIGYLWGENGILQYGIETGYEHLHRVKESSYQITLATHRYQIDALGVIDYFFCKNWDVFAKAGAAYTKQSLSASYEQTTHSVSLDKFSPKAVIGVGYNVTSSVNLNLSWEKNFNNPLSGSGLLAGIKYSF
jgi:opacity protein-like surface antigen